VFPSITYMPTEYKPGKPNNISSDSIVDVLAYSSTSAPQLSVDPKKSTEKSSKKTNKKNLEEKGQKPTPKEKLSIFTFIKNILLSDILWLSVSFACLLATVLFYFQILQPLILQKYSETAQAKIQESSQRYYVQLDQLNKSQQNIIAHTENLFSQTCSEDGKYDQSSKDRKDLENLKNTLVIDPKVKELPNFGIFYDDDIKDSYSKFISIYQNSLTDLQPLIANTKHIIEFVDYKNGWIDHCIAIKNSAGDTKELQAICNNIETNNNNYIKIAPAGIVDGLSKPNASVTSLCSEISLSINDIYPQYDDFKLKWLAEYDAVRELSLVTDSRSTVNIKYKFDSASYIVKTDIENSVQKRQDFANIWYLLSYST
jgi:hypothetical protein